MVKKNRKYNPPIHCDEDLHKIMDDFWNGPVENRTCKETGKVVERAEQFNIDDADEVSGDNCND